MISSYTKKATLLLCLIFIISEAGFVYADPSNTVEEITPADNVNMQLTAYGLFGTTTVNIGLDSTDDGNYGFGIQCLFGDRSDSLSNYFGMDIAYVRMFNVFSSEMDRGTSYLQMLLINEVVVWSTDWFGFLFQSGFGPYIGIDRDSPFGFDFYFGGGVEISIAPISIQIASRVDTVYYSFDEIIANVTYPIGIAYNF